MRLIAYARVSSEQQLEEGYSLSAQESKLKAYCDLYNHELVEIISEQGSGKSIRLRPGLTRALDMIKRGEADGLVVTKLDRLTRSIKDIQIMIDEVFNHPKVNGELHSVEDQLNTSTASGRLVLNVLISVSQWEREAIGERTSAALKHKRKMAGRKVTGSAPFGWQWTEGENRKLIPHPIEHEIIRTMIDLRNEGMTLKALADHLNTRGIKSKRGGLWYASSVKSALSSEDAQALAS